MIDRTLRPTSAFALLIAAAFAVASTACGNFTGVPASMYTLQDSGTAYALNGAPPSAPTALHMYSGTLVAADANFAFDIAFDIDSAGNPVILPERVVASALAATHSVGLQVVAGDYDAIDRAPRTGYHPDTALVVTPGQVVVVQSQDGNACSISLSGTTLYAKFVIDSVDLVNRQLSIRFTTDPNCGFYSFAAGLPKN